MEIYKIIVERRSYNALSNEYQMSTISTRFFANKDKALAEVEALKVALDKINGFDVAHKVLEMFEKQAFIDISSPDFSVKLNVIHVEE